MTVEADKMFHLGKEVGIGDVKEVAGLVRLQPVALQDTMQRGLTGCRTDLSTVRLQTTLSPSQCPSSAARQRLGLAIKCHDAQSDLLRVKGRAPQTGMIMEFSYPLGPPNPTTHATDRTEYQVGDGVERDPGIGQCDDSLSASQR